MTDNKPGCPICGIEGEQAGPCDYCVGRYGRVLAWATIIDESDYSLVLRQDVAYSILFSHCQINGHVSEWVTLFNAHRQDSEVQSMFQVLKSEIYLVTRKRRTQPI